MVSSSEWAGRASRYLKAELKRQGVTYEDLASRLNADGFKEAKPEAETEVKPETKASIANKLGRGAFTAAFFLASLKAIGTQVVRLEDF